MSDRKDGGPAFPADELNQQTGSVHTQHFGMSLRDYFAAKALQGLLADSNVSAERNKFAESAYELADAMLKAREQ